MSKCRCGGAQPALPTEIGEDLCEACCRRLEVLQLDGGGMEHIGADKIVHSNKSVDVIGGSLELLARPRSETVARRLVATNEQVQRMRERIAKVAYRLTGECWRGELPGPASTRNDDRPEWLFGKYDRLLDDIGYALDRIEDNIAALEGA